jgi:predicted transcriptional regulator
MSIKNSNLIGKTIEETKKYHEKYLNAINNPVRRKILRAIKDGHATVRKLQSFTGIDKKELTWHLKILEDVFCISKTSNKREIIYKITQEGKIVDCLE